MLRRSVVGVVVVLLSYALESSGYTPTPMPDIELRSPHNHGILRPLGDAHLLQLRGTPAERGYAHGYLLAAQIIDWSYSYQFLTNMKGDVNYYNDFSHWWREHQYVPAPYKEEIEAMYAGMVDSGVSLFFPGLNRPYTLMDLYVSNAYLEGTPGSGAMQAGPFTFIHRNPACTQFVTWGPGSSSGDVFAGRNMDGETDEAYVTVSHLLVIAVTPSDPSEQRYVSVTWPGHVGILSGVNEAGLSVMLNCGTTGSGPAVTNITAIEYILRDTLTSTNNAQGTTSLPEAISERMNAFRCSGGGISGAGSVLVFSNGHPTDASPAGFIYEVDRYGGLMRLPDDNVFQMAQSNHFLKYGVNVSEESDPENPAFNWDVEVGFSSRWRLEAAKDRLQSRLRVGAALEGIQDIAQILQSAAHGFTEHSIALMHAADGVKVALANADPWSSGAWDAPYRAFEVYEFDELFM